MNQDPLADYISRYQKYIKEQPETWAAYETDRAERLETYAKWTQKRLHDASEEDLIPLFSPLWSLAMWGDKAKRVAKIVANNGMETLRENLLDLLCGNDSVAKRWDRCRENVKGMGNSTVSELLGYRFPEDCMVWNSRSIEAMQALGAEDIPHNDYRLDGQEYVRACGMAHEVRAALRATLGREVNLLETNYFLWEVANWGAEKASGPEKPQKPERTTAKQTQFLHDDIKQKVADIGEWLGFSSQTEVKVADGSVVDATWEATIGNLGRVVYVFEVQTKGSIDSLILNLLKSKKNAAVQGVVAVSDAPQLEKIRKHAAYVDGLKDLRFWNYQSVIETHDRLQNVNETINALELVPVGF